MLKLNTVLIAIFVFVSISLSAEDRLFYSSKTGETIRLCYDKGELIQLNGLEKLEELKQILVSSGYKQSNKQKSYKTVGITTNHSYSPTVKDTPLSLVIYYPGKATTNLNKAFRQIKKML